MVETKHGHRAVRVHVFFSTILGFYVQAIICNRATVIFDSAGLFVGLIMLPVTMGGRSHSFAEWRPRDRLASKKKQIIPSMTVLFFPDHRQ